MAADHFLVARIDVSPAGRVTIAAVESRLRRGTATLLAGEQVAHTGEVHFVGSQRLRTIDVRLPEHNHAKAHVPPSGLAVRIAGWIDVLRAHGELSLALLAEHRPLQDVPAARLLDPQILAGLGIHLTPVPRGEILVPLGAEVFIADAPANSLAWLMRNSDLAADFAKWFAKVPMTTWPTLLIPLYYCSEDAGSRMQLGAWMRHNRSHPFLAGEALQLTLDATGQVSAWTQPVCCDGADWTSVIPKQQSTDAAWTHSGDVCLDRLFHHVPTLAERILQHAACQTIAAGASPSQALETLSAFRRPLDGQIRDAACHLTARLLQRSGLARVSTPQLSHAHFLHAHGDAIASSRRRQAIEAWPALAGELAIGQLPAACEAIDAARPLVPALSADFRVPGWAIRRLLKLLGQAPSRALTDFGGPAGLARLIAMAGAHAPAITPMDLESIAHWMRLLPQGDQGPAALMRALGAEAANAGWVAVATSLARPEIGDEAIRLLAWWDDLRANVADVLTRDWGPDVSPDQIDATFLGWLEHVPMLTALRFAAGWHGLLWGATTVDDPAAFEVHEVPAVIGALSLLQSRVQVTPISSLAALRDEGARMHHCVATYWRAVVGSRRFVCSLHCPATGARATAAWNYQPEGAWALSEAAGEGNTRIAEDSRLATALRELEELLADEPSLNQEALQRHMRAAVIRIAKGSDYAVEGACLVSMLPPTLARTALRFLPGAGSIEQRVICAARNSLGSLNLQLAAIV